MSGDYTNDRERGAPDPDAPVRASAALTLPEAVG
jgi:hypothetical protein